MNFSNIPKYGKPLQFLDDPSVRLIHNSSCRILEETGVKFDDEKTLSLFKDELCEIDEEKKIVKISRSLVDHCVKKIPRSFSLFSRELEEMKIGVDSLHFVSVADNSYILEGAKKIVEILSLAQDVTPEHCLNLILDDLSGDKCFEQFVFNYVKARFMHPKDKPKTLARMILEFEEGLKDVFPRSEWSKKSRDQQIARFLRSIEAWYICLTQSMTMSGSAVIGALNETLTRSN